MVCYVHADAARQVNHLCQPSWNAESMNVFLVEDSVIIRERLKRMLAIVERVQVIGEAGGVQEAMDAILKQKPDVVLLDIPFRNGSGLDLLQSLKKAKPAPAVIILSDYAYPLYRQKCLEAGADFFFAITSEFDLVVPALKQLIQPASDAGGASASPP
jgi:DNA-binding NarL/FixJ family response regulator